MALLLIRHGETDFNTGRVVQFPDTPLGAAGIAQAEALGASLRGRRLDLVLSSDYLRARMTAERIVAATRARLLESAHWRERHFGELRGRAYSEFGTRDIFARDYVPPGGESWPDFDARVDQAWSELLGHAASAAGDIAVVTHGLVLRSLIERVLDVGGHVVAPGITVANTSVTIVDHLPPWRVLELAGVAHLAAGAAREGAAV
ncbi:MAG: histidine phosphatase family protein [Gammaproteobacteria bacterium]